MATQDPEENAAANSSIQTNDLNALLLNAISAGEPVLSEDPMQATGNVTPQERVFINNAYEIGNYQIEQMLKKQENIAFVENDKQFKDIPKTGKADTRGGMARVNENTATHGVTAVRGDDGRITLTNIDPATKQPTPQSQVRTMGFNPMNASTSTSVSKLLGDLRNASDASTAQGIAASLRTSIAEEETRLNAESIKFAENQVGLPNLKRRLGESEALDQQTPGWVPGMGDSKNTAALRAAVYTAQSNANGVAEKWMKQNMSAAQLRAASENANAELTRISRLQQTKDAAATRQQERRENIEATREFQAQENYDSLSFSQKQIIARLEPALAAKPDNQRETVLYFERQMKNDPEFRTLMQTPPDQVPALALAGNSKARNLVIADEQASTGRAPAEIEQEMKTAIEIAKSGRSLDAWINSRVGNMPNATEQRRALRGEFDAAKLGVTKEAKENFKQQQQELAMFTYKQQRSNNFAMNVSSWADPELQPFIQQSIGLSGKSDMQSVLAAYVGDKSGPEALAAYELFRGKMKAAASKYATSPFGGLNVMQYDAMITDQARESGTLAAWWRQRFNKNGNTQILSAIASDPLSGISPGLSLLGSGFIGIAGNGSSGPQR